MAEEKRIIACPECAKKFDVSKYPPGYSFPCPACKATVGAAAKPQDVDDGELTIAGPAHDSGEAGPGEVPQNVHDGQTLLPGTLVEKGQAAPDRPAADAIVEEKEELASRGTGSRFTALEGFKRAKDTPKSKAGGAEGPGKKYGEYSVIREIGRGAMGVVYEAVQEGLNRRVALKVMLSNYTGSEEAVERFLREGQATARLKHPNIVSVFGLGEEDGDFYYAMAYVKGKSLKDALKDDVLTFKERAEIIRDSGRGLDFAHKEGVIHRDIKPANIMIDLDGKVLIADFGIAKTEESSTLTADGQILGTPMYMSPEQADGLPDVDNRADVYSLGATLYETLTLARPFHGEDIRSIIRNVLEVEPVSPRKIDPKIPRDLETICMKSLEKNREKRYDTAGDMADDIDRFLNGENILAKPLGIVGRVAKKMMKNKAVTALLLLLFLVVAGGAGFYAYTVQQKQADIARRLADARQSFEAGDFAEAREKYQGVEATDAKNGEARTGIEKCDIKIAHIAENKKEAEEKARRDKTRRENIAAAAKLTSEAEGVLGQGREAFEKAQDAFARGKASVGADLLDQAFTFTEKAVFTYSAALVKVRDHYDAEKGKVETYLLRSRVEIVQEDFGKALGYVIIARDTSKGRFFEKEIDELERAIAGTGHLTVGEPAGEGGTPRLAPGTAVELAVLDPDTLVESKTRTSLGATPLRHDIPMGNYILYLSHEGRSPARYPLLVGRNAELVVDFPLLDASAVPEGMVYVPPGEYVSGDSFSGQKTRYVEGYLIDTREVTHEDYRRFVEALENDKDKMRHAPRRRVGTKLVAYWLSEKTYAPYKGKNLPVYGITWESAAAYTAWAGRRLPTADEWEKAARGADGRLWPWGNEFKRNDRCNYYGRRKEINIEPVASYGEWSSPFGCLNMAGNVAEFTSTKGETIEVRGRFIQQYIVCGGSAADNKFNVMTTARTFVKPDMFGMGVGFRCAKDIP
jgi:formylglycine-generating enzyme required for sulfatase activity